jgi:hypothetical protein
MNFVNHTGAASPLFQSTSDELNASRRLPSAERKIREKDGRVVGRAGGRGPGMWVKAIAHLIGSIGEDLHVAAIGLDGELESWVSRDRAAKGMVFRGFGFYRRNMRVSAVNG